MQRRSFMQGIAAAFGIGLVGVPNVLPYPSSDWPGWDKAFSDHREASARLAASLDMSNKEAMDKLTYAIGRQSTMRLDNLGIHVSYHPVETFRERALRAINGLPG